MIHLYREEESNLEQLKKRILGIAPYESLKSVMTRLADARDDIDATVFVGDLEEGVKIVQEYQGQYDAIVSRGGTAQRIRQITSLPVIDISLSVYDVLRAIRLADGHNNGNLALVGFPVMTCAARTLCTLLQYEIDIYTIHSETEAHDAMIDLKSKGCKVVLCDMVSNTTAMRIGLHPILITSGDESIQNAYDQAVRLCQTHGRLLQEIHVLKQVLKEESELTIIMNESGEIISSLASQGDIGNFLPVLLRELSPSLKSNSRKFYMNAGDSLYCVRSHRILYENKSFVSFCLSQSFAPVTGSKYGICFSNLHEMEYKVLNSIYNLTAQFSTLSDMAKQLCHSMEPIMITGEDGTGKHHAAAFFYINSAYRNRPFISVDCASINEKNWNFFINHHDSPLSDNGNTLFISHLNKLSGERQAQLLALILDTGLCLRNRLIFSYTTPYHTAFSHEVTAYVLQLGCIAVELTPLRLVCDEIPDICSLYLSTLNFEFGKQIVGIEPSAMELLQSCQWPYNHAQLKQLLRQSVLISQGPYITQKDIRNFLSCVKPQPSGQNTLAHLDLSQSLEEITRDVIRAVLKKNGGNQSKTAKELGIGRTTLWRYLNQDTEVRATAGPPADEP